MSNHTISKRRGQILNWYAQNKRDLPWRAIGHEKLDPYRVWLSEIMLQQTTVQAVIPYFLKFIKLWPTIEALASASIDDVTKEWAGLGYYARARNLHKCAQIICQNFQGYFPETQKELLHLPGIGDYTSAAIITIAFNKPATVMDGNIERVIARLHAVQTALPKAKKELKELTSNYFENFTEQPGDLAQAFMDLGATICTPQNPTCHLCPINGSCKAYKAGIAESLPRKIKKKQNPQKHGHVYWIENKKGEILLERRQEKGMLGGMVGLPTSEWILEKEKITLNQYFKDTYETITLNKFITHSFTHFDLKLFLLKSNVTSQDNLPPHYFWLNKKEVADIGLPTLFKKAYKIAMK